MPTVFVLSGIRIRIYVEDHPPPHIHAVHAERNAIVRIDQVEVTYGGLSPPEQRLVVEWVRSHQAELLDAWNDARQGRLPRRIRT